jgi:hypothetical protein
MGGTGSGNYVGRPTVEAALKLDLHHLIRSGSFRPGATVTGSLAWTNNDTGEQRASIGYKAHMEDEHGWVRLTYATTNHWTGQTTQHDYTVELETTPQTFGGRRWWWVCPRRGDLVAKLYKPAGGGIFASRKAHRLACRSQRQSPYDRLSAKRSSAATVSERTAALAIPSTNPRECAGSPSTASWSRLKPQKPSAMPVSFGSSRSLFTADDGQALTSIHAKDDRGLRLRAGLVRPS